MPSLSVNEVSQIASSKSHMKALLVLSAILPLKEGSVLTEGLSSA